MYVLQFDNEPQGVELGNYATKIERVSPKGLAHDHAGRLVPHAWQRLQLLECVRHLAVVLFHQQAAQFGEVSCLGGGEADLPNQRLDFADLHHTIMSENDRDIQTFSLRFLIRQKLVEGGRTSNFAMASAVGPAANSAGVTSLTFLSVV